MERNPDLLWAAVMAAGTASRFGRQKLLASFLGEPMVCKSLRAAQHVAGGRVLLVTGHENAAVRAAANGLYDEAAYNARFEAGLGTSISTAIGHCNARADAVLLLLADQPLVTGTYLANMVHRWQETTADIVISTYRDTIGPPVIFSRPTFDSLRMLAADDGARRIVTSGEFSVERFGEQIENPDIDTIEDLEAAQLCNCR